MEVIQRKLGTVFFLAVQRFNGNAMPSRPNLTCALRLYVRGTSLDSMDAIKRMSAACNGCRWFNLEVIDVRESPALAEDANVMDTPSLIRGRQMPERRYVGNMENQKLAPCALHKSQ